MPDPRIHPITAVDDTFVTVLAVSTLVRAVNTSRAELDLVNDSDESIYLSRGAAAVLNSGMRLNANGGAYHMGPENIYYGAFYAICAGGDANLCVSEGSV